MEKKEHIEIILEDMQSKSQLILEGHAALKTKMGSNHREIKEELQLLKLKISYLNKKIDKVEDGLNRKITDLKSELSNRIDQVETNLTTKIDAVATDLAAHRADTEKHQTPYRVSE